MKGFKTLIIIFAVCMLVGILYYSDSRAVVVKQIHLLEMIDSAKYVFSGECTGREKSYDEDLQCDVYIYTFRVNRMFKGLPRNRISVKLSKMLVEMKQVPTYKTGDELVLFLYGESKIGFSSPVGLGQGKFSVRYSADGLKQVVNENNNLNLFKGISRKSFKNMFIKGHCQNKIDDLMARKSGPINYDLFVGLVDALVGDR